MTAQKRCSQPETDDSKTIWCMKPPFQHQWHHLVCIKTHSHEIIFNFKEALEDRKDLIHNQLYDYRCNTVETSHIHSQNLPTTKRSQKCINRNLFMLIIGNSKIHRVRKWLDSNKSLIVKSNKNDQRLGGEDTHNQWHEEKHANLTGKLINVCKNCWNWNKWCQRMTDW